MRRLLVLTLLVTLVAAGVACGDDDEGNAAPAPDGAIEIVMVDNTFEPAEVEVAAGEEVTFVFDNRGAALHEAYVGDEAAQEDHAMAMAEAEEAGETEHGGGHGDAEVLEVEAGHDGRLSHTFEQPGEYLIGCHQPGHYEDGMKLQVTVT
jgi:uncharacterized cupredoxin-like copper-binding protein